MDKETASLEQLGHELGRDQHYEESQKNLVWAPVAAARKYFIVNFTLDTQVL
ncbi:MAG: hypothetical protein H0T77_05505 [Pyrinomonadaceae bacterium]|nr:hypothetical protein [Pyrinomonadaceae bacterium]